MITSWIQSVLSLIASLCERLDGFGFWHEVRSFEPRAWLILMTIFLAFGGLTSFVRTTRLRMAATRRRSRRFDSAWDHRLDGE
jgi:drug/metabolite transporter superfamily protein YnfA